jgi:hypothetical protein
MPPHAARPSWRWDARQVGVWAALLAAALAGPWLLGAADPGDAVTRWTVRLALAYYALAAALMLRLRRPEWAARGRGRFARWCWTLGCAAFLVHVAAAFAFFHGWSHQRAYEATDRATGGYGAGLYVSYLFTLAWTADVVWWWVNPRSYAARPNRVGLALHGFLAFMVFNATVVFESGPTRWAGVVLFAGLTFLLLLRGAAGKPWRPDGDDATESAEDGSAISREW